MNNCPSGVVLALNGWTHGGHVILIALRPVGIDGRRPWRQATHTGTTSGDTDEDPFSERLFAVPLHLDQVVAAVVSVV